MDWLVYPTVPRQHLWTLDTLPISSLHLLLPFCALFTTRLSEYSSENTNLIMSHYPYQNPFRPQLSSVQLQNYLMWQMRPFVTSRIWSFLLFCSCTGLPAVLQRAKIILISRSQSMAPPLHEMLFSTTDTIGPY